MMFRTRFWPQRWGIALLVFSAAVGAHAQTQARITGKVVDESGTPLVGVLIEAEDLATSSTYDAETNKKGRFTIGVVNGANPHQVTISLAGYQTLANEVTPGAGGIFQQVFTLFPEGGAAAPVGGGAQQLEGGGQAIRLYNRGANLYNEGDKLAAREKLQEALTEDPTLVDAHKILASIALDRGEAEQALEHTQQFLAAHPEDGVGLTLRHDALVAAERGKEAAELIPSLAAARPDEETLARAFNAASGRYQADDIELAGKLLEAALSIDPGHSRSLLLLADVRSQQESYDEALELSERLLESEPDNVRALAIQHRIYVKTGDEAKAQAAFERLADADPVSVAATFAEEGARLFGAGQTQAAIGVLEQALELDPDNVTANYHLGVAYVGADRGSDARGLLSHFLELAPEHPEAEAARAMLQYLE